MIKKFLKDYSLWVAIVFSLMDLSGLVGRIGYKLYYPLLFFLAYLGITKYKKITTIYVVYLIACTLSILTNNIPSFYKIPLRFSGFIILFVAFTPLFTSRYLTIIRTKAIQYFCLFSVGVVVLNFALFKSGAISQNAIANFEQIGMYTGSTGNNEMGTLGGISLIYLCSLLCFKNYIAKKWFYISFALSFCNLAMTFLASSRSAILCSAAAILGMLYIKFKSKFGKLLGILCIVIIIGNIIAPMFNEYTRGIIEFKQGGDMSNFDTRSRDDIWEQRIKEFKSSPITGIGFGTISNPNEWTKHSGIVETGSSWLASLSQTGLLGTIPILIIVIGNIAYLLRLKNPDFIQTLFTGLTIFFTIHPISEGYFTTVGAILCVLFWCIHGIVYNMRTKVFLTSEIPLLFIKNRNHK
jgi:O-antigen ligase